MREMWRDAGWELLENVEESHVWREFQQKFQFSPRLHGSDTGIQEPVDSVTFDISWYYTSQEQNTLAQEVHEWLFHGFVAMNPPGASVYALDWQHPCYKVVLAEFDLRQYNTLLLHQNGLLRHAEDGGYYYLIPVIPDGDYSMFLTHDLTNGTFGHPWRETLCIFGKDLLEELNTADAETAPKACPKTWEADRGQGGLKEMARKINVLALDLEGTLIATAAMPVPRPGLYHFLEWCRTRFERVVMLTSVPEHLFRHIAKQLVVAAHAPRWFQDIEYVAWEGEKKDLMWIPGIHPYEALLLDDFGVFIKAEQRTQWIEIESFDYPFPQDDNEFTRVMPILEQHLAK